MQSSSTPPLASWLKSQISSWIMAMWWIKVAPCWECDSCRLFNRRHLWTRPPVFTSPCFPLLSLYPPPLFPSSLFSSPLQFSPPPFPMCQGGQTMKMLSWSLLHHFCFSLSYVCWKRDHDHYQSFFSSMGSLYQRKHLIGPIATSIFKRIIIAFKNFAIEMLKC